ncbi:MAG: hypothetical protein JST75_18655 [Bacteroidetes bacterium]|nr:hypothetical protein [Bacteroidota bacterium]
MKNLLICSFIFFAACGPSAEYKKYQAIVAQADSVNIRFLDAPKKILLSAGQLDRLKNALEEIKPEPQRKFIPNATVELFKKNKRLGYFIMMTGHETPFANFIADSLNIGFPMTYKLGMFLDAVR